MGIIGEVAYLEFAFKKDLLERRVFTALTVKQFPLIFHSMAILNIISLQKIVTLASCSQNENMYFLALSIPLNKYIFVWSSDPYSD